MPGRWSEGELGCVMSSVVNCVEVVSAGGIVEASLAISGEERRSKMVRTLSGGMRARSAERPAGVMAFGAALR